VLPLKVVFLRLDAKSIYITSFVNGHFVLSSKRDSTILQATTSAVFYLLIGLVDSLFPRDMLPYSAASDEPLTQV